ncbi:MAG: hypothetical protein NC485_02095 [Ruminococcus flavefaciens]|nr:hypothetical protein [Ruminococcus flavefaciens]MCM1062459.1 hypothetical protein [Eubacterium sp.]
MQKIVIKRKRKFASALLPYWVITNINKKEFMCKYNLDGDLCKFNVMGQAIPRIEISILDSIGVRISNGQTVEIELDDEVETIFASTMDGCLSNEIKLKDFSINEQSYEIFLSTKGGFKNLSYPYFEQ